MVWNGGTLKEVVARSRWLCEWSRTQVIIHTHTIYIYMPVYPFILSGCGEFCSKHTLVQERSFARLRGDSFLACVPHLFSAT